MPGSHASSEPSFTVIGAGPAGLAIATALRELGHRTVVVLEKAGRAGGQCVGVEIGGARYDLGAVFTGMSRPHFDRLLARHAVSPEPLPIRVVRSGRARVYLHDLLRRVPVHG